MAFPRWLARMNRWVANPVVGLVAGRLGPLAVVGHEGRSSGRRYRTPVVAFTTDDGWYIALTYDRGTDWQHNLEAAGGGTLRIRGTTHRITRPTVTDTPPTGTIPRSIRWYLRLVGAEWYLHLTRA